MNERVEAVILTNEDAAIQAIVNAIAGLNHWAIAGKSGVIADKGQLRALAARSIGVKAQHLSSVLLTLQERDNIFASRNLSITVLKGRTDTDTIYGKMAVGVLTFGIVAS